MFSGRVAAGEFELLAALRDIEKASPGATAKFAAAFAALKSISKLKLTGDGILNSFPNMPHAQTVPFVRTSRTSRAAAESLETTVKIIQWRILRTIAEAPNGLTCAEIERKLPRLRQSTVSGRVSDLKDIGALVAKGVRPGATGRPVDVLYATTKGRKAVSL